MNGKMKALVMSGTNNYGIQKVDIPKVGHKEVLVRIRAIAICGSDPKILNGKEEPVWPPYYPFIAGHEFSGEVVELGNDVTEFKVGDRIAGEAHKGCGYCRNCIKGKYNLCLNYGENKKGHRHYGFTSQGAYAEYNAYSVKALTKIPDSMTFAEATMIDTVGIAYHAVNLSGVTAGGISVVIGPGPVGMFSMQIAKAMGSKTIVIGRGLRLQMAKKFGADVIVDYEKESPLGAVKEITNRVGANEVFECSGSPDAIYNSLYMAAKGGKVVFIGNPPEVDQTLPIKVAILNELELFGSRGDPNSIAQAVELISTGKINAKDLITHEFPLSKMDIAVETFLTRKDGAMKVVVIP